MCGIIGYVGKNKNCVHVLIDGLERLEYRGYDSSGIAYVKDNNLEIIKKEGRISNLKSNLNLDEKSDLGIGHTRWATHGKASENNAHPHRVGKFTIVHNGIIENYNDLKKDLILKGYSFKSDTDSEVACALLDYLYKSDNNILNVINKANQILKGAYAIGIICDDNKDKLYAIKKNSPLIIGVGNNENYIASDVPAILKNTKRYIILDDGDYAEISNCDINLYNKGKDKKYEIKTFDFNDNSIEKNGYENFMLKEIHEQPDVFKKTVNPYFENGIDSLIKKMPDFSKYKQITIVACGSATHASMVGKQMIERYANIKVNIETASEFRYNKLFLSKDELVILVSQSGETADTLEALKIAKDNGNDTLGIINVKGSSIARAAKMVLYTEAGSEIAVATTKAYSAQIAMLSLIALNIATYKNNVSKKELVEIIKDIKKLPIYMEDLLNNNEKYKQIADYISKYNDVFYIGRGVDYALSEEGSLKLKEISYTHSEAYPAGELKHGTISLIEEGTPVIAIVTDDKIASKTISNIKEVKSRGANVIYITNKDTDENFYDNKILIPKVDDLFSPLLSVIPLQLIAYYVAKNKNCSIDKPRNLAKSVTVE